MPRIRNFSYNRRSSDRILKRSPVAYDKKGWEIPDASLMQDVATSPRPSAATSRTPGPDLIPGDRERPPTRPSTSPIKYNDKIPRPKNAFIHFRSHFYQMQKQIGSCLSQTQISQQAGLVWGLLSKEEREPYQLLAAQESREHREKYPDYVYTPGKGKTKPKHKGRPGGIKKRRPKRTISSDTVDSESLPPSPYPTRLSLESERAPSARCQASLIPQTMSPDVETKPEFAACKSESASPAAFNLNCGFVPTEEIPPLELSPHKVEKASEFDLSLRPPSYDFIDAPLGLKATITPIMELFLPATLAPSPDNDNDFELFAQIIDSSASSLIEPSVHGEEDQTMSSYDDCYTDNDIGKSPTISAASDNIKLMSPVIRSSSISKAEEVEMSQYVDFDYGY